MKTILFLSRVTFIYNLCMVATLLMRLFNFIPEGSLKSTILVGGLLLSGVCNLLIIGCLAVMLIRGSTFKSFQPRWLFTVNLFFFIFQFYMLLK
jgi:hypothetical protein